MSYETPHFHSSTNVREEDEVSNSKLVSSEGNLPIVRRSKKFHLIGGGISSSTATSSFKYHPRTTVNRDRMKINSFEESAHKLYEGTKGAYQSQRLINYHLSTSGLPTKSKDYSPNQICIPENVKSFAELVGNFRKSLHNFQIPKLHEKSERVLSDISFDKEGKVGENLVNNLSSYANYSSDSASDTESIAPTLEDLEQQIDDWWNSDETKNKLREATILPDYNNEVLNLWDEVPVGETKKKEVSQKSNTNLTPKSRKKSIFRPSESGDTFHNCKESVSSVECINGERKEKQRGRIMRCLAAIVNFFWKKGK